MGRRVPKYCLHRSSGRAYVTDPASGREVYFPGVYDSGVSVAAYEAWVRDYLARGPADSARAAGGAKGLTVAGLWDAFLDHAEAYYRKHDQPTSAVNNFRRGAVWCLDAWGALPAAEVTPLRLRALRDAMVAHGLNRSTVNKYLGAVRHCWRWAVAEELVPPSVLEGLRAVPNFPRGRGAKETPRVPPVPEALLEQTLPILEAHVRALAVFQAATGCRPGEAVCLRPCDLERAVTPWLYTPWTWKTEHKGGERRIWVGPRARAAVLPYLDACATPESWAFPSPRFPGQHLAEASYWGHLARACRRHGLPHFTPNQLRHLRGTTARREGGLEAAQAVLGHEDIGTTQIYAARQDDLARDLAERTG
jgi:integrase